MPLSDFTDKEKPPESIELEYLPDEGIFIAHYTGTEHGTSKSNDDIPAMTADGESRQEALLKLISDIMEWDDTGDVTVGEKDFVFHWE